MAAARGRHVVTSALVLCTLAAGCTGPAAEAPEQPRHLVGLGVPLGPAGRAGHADLRRLRLPGQRRGLRRARALLHQEQPHHRRGRARPRRHRRDGLLRAGLRGGEPARRVPRRPRPPARPRRAGHGAAGRRPARGARPRLRRRLPARRPRVVRRVGRAPVHAARRLPDGRLLQQGPRRPDPARGGGGDAAERRGRLDLEEFSLAARQASRVRGKGVYIEPTLRALAPFVWSAGADIVDDVQDPTTLTLSEGDTREALEEVLALVRDPLVTPTRAELAGGGRAEPLPAGPPRDDPRHPRSPPRCAPRRTSTST